MFMERNLSRSEYITNIEGRISRREFFQVGLTLASAGSVAGVTYGLYDLRRIVNQMGDITKNAKPIDPTVVYQAKQTVENSPVREVPPMPAISTAEAVVHQDEKDQKEMERQLQEKDVRNRIQRDTLLVTLVLPGILSIVGLGDLLRTKKRLQKVRDELTTHHGSVVIGGRLASKEYLTPEEVAMYEQRISPPVIPYSSD